MEDTSTSTISGALASIQARFDHVAKAVPSIREALPLYTDLMGGHVRSGGINPWGGHVAIQIEFPGSKEKVELLEPLTVDSPAVDAFLQRNPRGGLHHVTFRVSDLVHAISLLHEAGYEPFGTRLEAGQWRETYLHPRQTGGVLLQLAQAGDDVPGPLGMKVEELLDRADEERQRLADAPTDG